jgi:peptide/nickel transport system substrate-binding protein
MKSARSMKLRLLRRAPIALLALPLVISACGGSGAPTPSGSATANSTFTYAFFTDFMNVWDPATAYEYETIAMQEMYQQLTYYNVAREQIQPSLAVSWSSSNGQKTWTFDIRHNVYFHTGRLLTAQAAKAAIERTISLGQGASYIWSDVKSISTPSQYTLEFQLSAPEVFDKVVSSGYGAYIYDTNAANGGNLANWLNKGNDAGTGPYTVASWNPTQEVPLTLRHFPKYWGGWKGTHYTTIDYRVVEQGITTAQLMRSKQITFAATMPPYLFKTFQGQSGFQALQATSWQNMLLQLNVQAPPLNNLLFRQAVAYAVNYPGLIAVNKGIGSRTPGIFPPGIVGYDPHGAQYTYNLAKAEQLKKESGVGNVTLTAVRVAGFTDEPLDAGVIQSNLAAIGVKLQVSTLSPVAFSARTRSTQASQHFDMAFEQWYPDYGNATSWLYSLYETQKPGHVTFNLSYYSNPLLDKEINSVDPLLATDPSAGVQALYGIQNTIYQTVPSLTLYNYLNQRVLLAGVKGYYDNPSYPNVVFVYDLTP